MTDDEIKRQASESERARQNRRELIAKLIEPMSFANEAGLSSEAYVLSSLMSSMLIGNTTDLAMAIAQSKR